MITIGILSQKEQRLPHLRFQLISLPVPPGKVLLLKDTVGKAILSRSRLWIWHSHGINLFQGSTLLLGQPDHVAGAYTQTKDEGESRSQSRLVGLVLRKEEPDIPSIGTVGLGISLGCLILNGEILGIPDTIGLGHLGPGHLDPGITGLDHTGPGHIDLGHLGLSLLGQTGIDMRVLGKLDILGLVLFQSLK